jgi:Tol biopolymer transport system component
VVDAHSYAVERVTLPLSSVSALAVSVNRREFAAIAPSGHGGQQGLWTWSRSERVPTEIGSEVGRYSDPAFEARGEWLYFSHSPSDGIQHMFGMYAQLFRVHPDGSELERVTDERGCHYSATVTAWGNLTYVHSSCSGNSWVKRADKSLQAETLVSAMGSVAEASTAPDASGVLYVGAGPDTFDLNEARKRVKSPRLITRLRRNMVQVRPQYGKSRNEILYQGDGTVWLWRNGVTASLVSLSSPIQEASR